MEVYKVMETFYSIQGEGFHTGRPAYFIRLAGCDVGCSWCDVKESWGTQNSEQKNADELTKEVIESGAESVIITGGEPAMYNLSSLTSHLQKAGLKTHLETSGAYPITGSWDWICISPKKFKEPLKDQMSKANELKVVVVNKSDFEWGEKYASLVSNECELFLQPEWSKTEKITERMNEYVKEHPKWRISLQTHKYMNVR